MSIVDLEKEKIIKLYYCDFIAKKIIDYYRKSRYCETEKRFKVFIDTRDIGCISEELLKILCRNGIISVGGYTIKTKMQIRSFGGLEWVYKRIGVDYPLRSDPPIKKVDIGQWQQK